MMLVSFPFHESVLGGYGCGTPASSASSKATHFPFMNTADWPHATVFFFCSSALACVARSSTAPSTSASSPSPCRRSGDDDDGRALKGRWPPAPAIPVVVVELGRRGPRTMGQSVRALGTTQTTHATIIGL